MKVIGLDIGRGNAVADALEEFPKNIQKHFKEHKKEIVKIKADTTGAEKLLTMQPDVIVLEPTGFWYSSFWYTLAKHHNIKIEWIGHADLKGQRKSYGFTNKDDYTDALCLSATYFDCRFIDEHDRPRFLKNYLPEEILELRENFYKIEQLDKIRNAQVNQLRQRLCAEFPEIARILIKRQGKNTYSPTLGWLAGIHKHTRLENRWKNSHNYKLGLEITPYTRQHAASIVDIEVRTSELEDQLEEILEREIYFNYLKVFDLFGFGPTLKSLLLLQCYPFDRFLINGKAYKEKDESKNGKRVTRHRSLSEFQAYMGMSYSIEESGDSKKKRFHGSKLVRSHLYAWIKARICTGQTEETKARRCQTPLAQKLGKEYDEMRNSLHGKDAITRLLFKLTRYLFYELYKELT